MITVLIYLLVAEIVIGIIVWACMKNLELKIMIFDDYDSERLHKKMNRLEMMFAATCFAAAFTLSYLLSYI